MDVLSYIALIYFVVYVLLIFYSHHQSQYSTNSKSKSFWTGFSDGISLRFIWGHIWKK